MAEGRRGAFALDAAIHTAAAAAKAAWWTAAGRATRALVRPIEGEQAAKFKPTLVYVDRENRLTHTNHSIPAQAA